MARILVSGLITIEATVQVGAFPVQYHPVSYPFFGTGITVSGVGYNVARALHLLEHEVALLSIVGRDSMADLARLELAKSGLSDNGLCAGIDDTSSSVILYNQRGDRSIYCDLKNIQETVFPEAQFIQAMDQAELAVLCNINYNRPFLEHARKMGIPVATDVHVISSLHDEYNADFMRAADILFMSHENLPCSPEEWIGNLVRVYDPAIAVIGLGGEGTLLYVRQDQFVGRFPAYHLRPVVNTIGAGDALFSAFVASYVRERDPYTALKKAQLFAAYKIGEKGASQGFLDRTGLEEFYAHSHR